MPWLALAVLGGSVYQAQETRKAARSARNMAKSEAAQTYQTQQQQLAVQRQQANTARERLDYEMSRSREDRARLDSEAKKISDELEAEQRKMAKAESSRMSAARRGGRRALLSQERLNPELGLTSYEDILGTGVNI
jgi:predicted  nucleic acid-binding Zn-ribbon protein